MWNNAIEPWWVNIQIITDPTRCRLTRDLYEANNLVQILTKASIEFPPDATKEQLIEVSNRIDRHIDEPFLLDSTGEPEWISWQTEKLSILDARCTELQTMVYFSNCIIRIIHLRTLLFE